ncbi:MAG: dihydroorotate dehydrogenase electron transfer subunit [Clostridium sp.]|jgi:dihydroorotate dehydrogenase electron transfer subunit|nr:dihydroorotate dehydrogenase electron transfer subunit [Clostridium sp.]
MKKKTKAKILFQKEIAPAVFDLWLEADLAEQARPGQFLCLYPKEKDTLLPRPISVCEAAPDGRTLRLVYRVAGQGTREFSGYGKGGELAVLGPLGNGFPLPEAAGKKALLIGGGIGIPPLLQLARELRGEKQTVLGYRDGNLFLEEAFRREGRCEIATEDGSVGTKGNVMDAVRKNCLEGDVIFACGPLPLLRAVKRYGAERGSRTFLSLEEHMACGIGACLGCVVRTRETEPRSRVKNARICTEGPVFEAGEVEIG